MAVEIAMAKTGMLEIALVAIVALVVAAALAQTALQVAVQAAEAEAVLGETKTPEATAKAELHRREKLKRLNVYL